MPTSSNRLFDFSAIGLSGLCLAHCLILPLAAAALPAFTAWSRAEWVHGLFVAVAAPLTGFALWRVHLSHPLPGRLIVLAVAGLVLLLNPAWAAADLFGGFRTLAIDPAEPFAANTLTVGGRLIVQAEAPRTAAILAGAGYAPHPVAISEFAKAEAGLTCLSLIFVAKSVML